MLSQAIGGLLPSAVGVALSPLPIIAVVLMLGTPRARSNGVAFAIGWVGGLAIVSAIVLAAAHGANTSNSASSDGVRWGTLGLGVLFLVMAARQWRKRPKKGETAAMPKWLSSLDGFSAPKSLGLGALLSGVNPKNLALTAAAAASIAKVGLPAGQEAIATAAFIAIASLTVAGPVLFYLVASRRARQPLEEIKTFMAEHNSVIMCVVLLVLGAKLIGSGIAG